MISSNVPRMLKRMVFARGYSERMSNNLAPSPRVWRGRDALQERVPTMANARTKPHAEGSAPVVYDRSSGRVRRTRRITHQLLQETLSLFPVCVEMLDAAFDLRRSDKLVHWLRLHLCLRLCL